MARPIWNGAISFGLVTVPVQLYSATSDHSVHFRQHTAQASRWGDSGSLCCAPALAGEVPAVAGGVDEAGLIAVR